MPLPQDSAVVALHLVIKKYIGDALNPVFQGLSEMASKLPGDQREIRLGLLEEVETAFAEIIGEKKERGNRSQSVAARGR